MRYTDFYVILMSLLNMKRNEVELAIVASVNFDVGHREAIATYAKVRLNNLFRRIHTALPNSCMI